eukprot:1875342-Amphidinium_carterae.1
MFGLKRSASQDLEKQLEKKQKLELEINNIQGTKLMLEMVEVFKQAPWVLEEAHKYVFNMYRGGHAGFISPDAKNKGSPSLCDQSRDDISVASFQ